MIGFQKNKLLNLALQLEAANEEIKNSNQDTFFYIPINRNIQSIKAIIKRA